MGVRFSLEAVLFVSFFLCVKEFFFGWEDFSFLCWLAGCGGPSASVEDIFTCALEVLLCSGLLPTSLLWGTLLYLLWPLRVVCCSCDQSDVHNGVYDWKGSHLPITPFYHLWKCKMKFRVSVNDQREKGQNISAIFDHHHPTWRWRKSTRSMGSTSTPGFQPEGWRSLWKSAKPHNLGSESWNEIREILPARDPTGQPQLVSLAIE